MTDQLPDQQLREQISNHLSIAKQTGPNGIDIEVEHIIDLIKSTQAEAYRQGQEDFVSKLVDKIAAGKVELTLIVKELAELQDNVKDRS